MKIKNKLSLQFTFMFAVLLMLVLAGIYLFVEQSRQKAFFSKLDDRAVTVAQFYLAGDNLSKAKFNDVLKKFPQSLSGEVLRIYDDKFRPQFIPEKLARWNVDVLKNVLTQKKVHFTQGDQQVTGIYYEDNSGNFIIMVEAIDFTGYSDMHRLKLIMLSFFLSSLLVTFFTGRIFSRFALLPIVNTTTNLKQIRSSSLDLRLPVNIKKTDEIDNLAITINLLLEHLQQSFESQQSFIANASHELRTPITTILGEAETTLVHDRDKEDYKATLVNIIKEAERLNNIINSLMELIQANAAAREFEPIRMDELLWEIEDELSGEKLKITYHLPANPQKYTLPGNRQLLFIAISNIIKNAIKFSDHKEVFCELFCDQPGIHVIIRDNGIGMDPKDVTNIFQPFYRAANALSYAGYGIGLSLTQNILRLHNATITVQSQLNQGTAFHILFPYEQ